MTYPLRKIEGEIMLKVGLRTVDGHEVEGVDTLLDSGATGLLTMCGYVKRGSQCINLSIHNSWPTRPMQLTLDKYFPGTQPNGRQLATCTSKHQ